MASALDKGRRRKDAYAEARLAALLAGDISVSDLSDDEIEKERVANSDGSFPSGRKPKLPNRIHTQMRAEGIRRVKRRVEKFGVKAIEIIEELASSAETEQVSLAAAKFLAEHTIGKPLERVVVVDEDPWDTILSDIMEDERGDLGERSQDGSGPGRRPRQKKARTDR